MELPEGYSVVRTLDRGRPPWGRWEVYDGCLLVGVVAEERGGPDGRLSTFTALHHPTPTPFVVRPSRHLRARGSWWSVGHATLPRAVAALADHLEGRSGERRAHHFNTPVR